ncbi:MAG: ABC transporter permease [Planctomycetota bacterium]
MNLLGLVGRELSHRKGQAVSGLLAIVLGVAVIVALRSVTRVSEIAVATKLDNLGANILVLPQGTSVDDYRSADIDAPTLPEAYVERIVASTLPGVDNLSPKLTRRMELAGHKLVVTGILPSNEIASKPVWQLDGLSGGAAHSCSKDAGAYVNPRLKRKAVGSLAETACLVGAAAAARLKVEKGGVVDLLGTPLKVEAVLPETGTVDDDRVFVHLRTMQRVTSTKGQVSSIEIMGCCNAITDGLLGKLRNVLPDTKITTVQQIVATQIETNALVKKVSFAFLWVVLVVGGLSIGNSIWANVNQRRRELGILRLLGTPRRGIYGLLLGKAAILGVLGGFLGWVIGTIAGSTLGADITGLEVRPVGSLLGTSLLVAVGTALLGAFLPAHLASRIEPQADLGET